MANRTVPQSEESRRWDLDGDGGKSYGIMLWADGPFTPRSRLGVCMCIRRVQVQ
jgi:hypothetical protein